MGSDRQSVDIDANSPSGWALTIIVVLTAWSWLHIIKMSDQLDRIEAKLGISEAAPDGE